MNIVKIRMSKYDEAIDELKACAEEFGEENLEFVTIVRIKDSNINNDFGVQVISNCFDHGYQDKIIAILESGKVSVFNYIQGLE